MIFPEDRAVIGWSQGDILFSIVEHPIGFYCGYARFRERPTISRGYEGILSYVPVHGGITYAEQHKDGTIVYGFDCGHAGDESIPELKDIEWLKAECQRMACYIIVAATHEEKYVLARTDEEQEQAINDFLTEINALNP